MLKLGVSLTVLSFFDSAAMAQWANGLTDFINTAECIKPATDSVSHLLFGLLFLLNDQAILSPQATRWLLSIGTFNILLIQLLPHRFA